MRNHGTSGGGGIDPFRVGAGGRVPSLDSVARGILHSPVLMAEILELAAWLEPEILTQLRAACDDALTHRAEVLARVADGTFARRHHGIPID